MPKSNRKKKEQERKWENKSEAQQKETSALLSFLLRRKNKAVRVNGNDDGVIDSRITEGDVESAFREDGGESVSRITEGDVESAFREDGGESVSRITEGDVESAFREDGGESVSRITEGDVESAFREDGGESVSRITEGDVESAFREDGGESVSRITEGDVESAFREDGGESVSRITEGDVESAFREDGGERGGKEGSSLGRRPSFIKRKISQWTSRDSFRRWLWLNSLSSLWEDPKVISRVSLERSQSLMGDSAAFKGLPSCQNQSTPLTGSLNNLGISHSHTEPCSRVPYQDHGGAERQRCEDVCQKVAAKHAVKKVAKPPAAQDWRRLVGSIRRRVRGPTRAAPATGSGCKVPALLSSADPAVREDFLKATMRIFLVVSPPGRIQGRCRSLTSIDSLDPGMMTKGQPDVDSRSEPDTSDRLIVPPGTAETSSSHRRQKLARSQVSSSEYFSVSFEIGEDSLPNEFVPATKGVTLQDALAKVCARRGVDVKEVNVFLDVSNTPLPLSNTEAARLGGRHLRVKAKDERAARASSKLAQVSMRKSAGSYRGKSGRFFSSSTEDPTYPESLSQENLLKNKASKQRWSSLFGNNKDTKMESLVEQLNNYSKQGIPHALAHQDESEEGMYNLEDDWRDIVTTCADLSERLGHQQTAIWELVQTEVAYIRTLKVIINLFVACLCNLQAANILSEIDKARLFSNITEIYSANRRFWLQHILPMLAAARETRQPFDPRLMMEGFVKFDEIFEPYTKYCAEQSQCQQYCREKHQENELFTAYLVWCETQKDCNRLRLMDIVVKPMQRLTKYSLLLKAIHKNSDVEDHRTSLETMIKRVDDFVNSVNTTLRQRQYQERIRGISARIESYDVVETKDDELDKMVRLYSDLDLTCPMPGCPVSHRRHLIMESDFKLKDNITSKMDVHCFLFTDLLLVCKVTAKKEGRVKVVRQPYVVSRLVIQEVARDPPTLALVYLNEYGTVSAAFTLSSSEEKLIKSWHEGVRKAQDLYLAVRLVALTPAAPVSRQPSSTSCYLEDVDMDGEVDGDSQSCASLNLVGGLALSRSSRGSRMSSLAHSHSGSMEMNEASSMSSMSHSRGVSVENEIRGSSLSSDEGNPILGPPDSKATLPNPTSPVPPHRTIPIPKSPSPNTLSIQVPIFSGLGQSLPNLNIATPTPPTSLLLVPSATKSSHHSLLSPGHRGVSYPPPSPPRGSLRRAFAIPQSRNPPLLKTRHVNSTTCSLGVGGNSSQKLHITPVSSFDFDVPVIAGVSPPSEESTTPEPIESSSSRAPRHALMKRLTRSDNRRYHTAGAIDDLKKQDSRDTSIHKRLSWNCGQQGSSTGNSPATSASSLVRGQTAKRFVSTESVQSSSGVSSTESGQFGSTTSGLDTPDVTEDAASGLPTYEETQSCCYDLPHLPYPSPATEAINMELVKSCTGRVPKHTVECAESVENTTLASAQESRLRFNELLQDDPSMEASNV